MGVIHTQHIKKFMKLSKTRNLLSDFRKKEEVRRKGLRVPDIVYKQVSEELSHFEKWYRYYKYAAVILFMFSLTCLFLLEKQ
jgi:hypothetical protein